MERAHIEEEIPLKQGLKLAVHFVVKIIMADWRGDSTKTRIETNQIERIILNFFSIEEEIPLKQGLKQNTNGRKRPLRLIEEEIPLKQGLKHICSPDTWVRPCYWRGDSTKTRIETKRV